jgi:hypothetical protein
MAIDVARDYEGLHIAADELFEETLTAKDQERRLKNAENAGNREQMLQQLAPPRKLAAGYYSWLGYIFDLEETIANGIHFGPNDLLATEVQGLRVVRAARDRFHKKYPGCPRCSQPNQKLAMKCSGCGAELQAKKDPMRRSA